MGTGTTTRNVRPASASVAASGSDLEAGGAKSYAFATPVRAAIVQFHPDATGLLYVLVNADGAGPTKYDAVLEPGGTFVFEIDDVLVRKVSLGSDEAQVVNTDFAVRGWI